MEWVETTARSIEEAKDAALDQLGVDEQEAEFEIVEEPRAGLFGRVRGEARVRARVAPRQPRPRQERGRGRGQRGGEQAPKSRGSQSVEDVATGGSPAPERAAAAPSDLATKPRGDRTAPTSSNRPANESRPTRRDRGGSGERETTTMDDTIVSADEQADIIATFLGGLLEAFGLDGEVRRTKADDDTVELDLQGEDLGLLIGPKGQTLTALHDLSRTVLQRQATGRYEGRVRIDVSGYRMKRRDALARFAAQVAAQVRESGVQKSLEPMNSADRKVVHDTISEIEAVATRSDGQEPNRRVVIMPDSTDE